MNSCASSLLLLQKPKSVREHNIWALPTEQKETLIAAGKPSEPN